MGDACSAKNLTALTRAKGQLDGMDPFREADRLKAMKAEQKAYYELGMADLMGINPKLKPGKVSVFDVLENAGVKTRAKDQPAKIRQLADGELYDTPSVILPEKFYNSVDKKLTEFVKKSSKGEPKEVRAVYSKEVSSPVRKLLYQLDGQIAKSKTQRQLAKNIKGFGLTPESVYEAREWLQWLGDGGHLQTDKNAIGFAAQHLSRGMANMNLLWSFGNVADMIRVVSHYSNKPGFLKAFSKVMGDNIKNNVFKRRSDLNKKGIYSFQGGTERINFGNRDPFSWSLTMQKNITHDLDVAMGGNGTDAIENLVFDTKPWNVPRLYRVKDPSGIFGLVRYPINESRWLLKETLKLKDAVANRDIKALQEVGTPLMVYLGARSIILGPDSNIPTPIYEALPDENEEMPLFSKQFWGKFRDASLVHGGANRALQAAGIDAKLDLTSYFQPFGGKLAVRYGLVSDTVQSVGKQSTKAAVNVAKGDLTPVPFEIAAAASALNNIFGLGQTLKAIKPASQLADKVTPIGDALNATVLTKMLDTTAKALDEEYTGGRYTRELIKDIAGSRRVKKADTDTGQGRPKTPKRPKRKAR